MTPGDDFILWFYRLYGTTGFKVLLVAIAVVFIFLTPQCPLWGRRDRSDWWCDDPSTHETFNDWTDIK
jgi:hypothetical protein